MFLPLCIELGYLDSWCIFFYVCLGYLKCPSRIFALVGWSWWPFRVETMISGLAQLCQHEHVAPTTLAKRPHYFSILIYIIYLFIYLFIYIYIHISQLQRLQKLANVTMHLKVKASRVTTKSSQGLPIFPYISQSCPMVSGIFPINFHWFRDVFPPAPLGSVIIRRSLGLAGS